MKCENRRHVWIVRRSSQRSRAARGGRAALGAAGAGRPTVSRSAARTGDRRRTRSERAGRCRIIRTIFSGEWSHSRWALTERRSRMRRREPGPQESASEVCWCGGQACRAGRRGSGARYPGTAGAGAAAARRGGISDTV